jgi:hypothetical protein
MFPKKRAVFDVWGLTKREIGHLLAQLQHLYRVTALFVTLAYDLIRLAQPGVPMMAFHFAISQTIYLLAARTLQYRRVYRSVTGS